MSLSEQFARHSWLRGDVPRRERRREPDLPESWSRDMGRNPFRYPLGPVEIYLLSLLVPAWYLLVGTYWLGVILVFLPLLLVIIVVELRGGSGRQGGC